VDTPVPVPTVIVDLADDPRCARDVAAGRVFVPGCALAINSDCALVVRGPLEEIELAARVVFVDERAGAGLELVGFSSELRDHLTRLLGGWCATLAELTASAATAPASTDDAGPIDLGIVDAPGAAGTADAGADASGVAPPGANRVAGDVPRTTGEPPSGDLPTGEPPADAIAAQGTAANADDGEPDDDDEPDPERRRLARNYYERLRGLTVAQQIKAAHSADPQERIILERLYNKTVWEPLLRNPRLTPPEVARIARMGTVPRVLLEIIVGNGAWLQMPEVRRALLANPRLGTDQIVRILRLLPKHELKLAAVQTAYPHAVREAARRMLKD